MVGVVNEVEYNYILEGNKIKINAGDGVSQVLTINEDGFISGLGDKFSKKHNAKNAAVQPAADITNVSVCKKIIKTFARFQTDLNNAISLDSSKSSENQVKESRVVIEQVFYESGYNYTKTLHQTAEKRFFAFRKNTRLFREVKLVALIVTIPLRYWGDLPYYDLKSTYSSVELSDMKKILKEVRKFLKEDRKNLPEIKTKKTGELNAKYRTNIKLKFRSKPGTKEKVLRMLEQGTAVYPTGKKSGKWWQVKVKEKKGWVHSNYIKK